MKWTSPCLTPRSGYRIRPSLDLLLILQLAHNALPGFFKADDLAAMLLPHHFSIFAPGEGKQARHAPVVLHFLIGAFVGPETGSRCSTP